MYSNRLLHEEEQEESSGIQHLASVLSSLWPVLNSSLIPLPALETLIVIDANFCS